MPRLLPVEPLVPELFVPFGNVIQTHRGAATANQGSARRSNHLAPFENLRPLAALNVCVFQAAPRALPFVVERLERHPFSTQMFVPMNATRYLVVVAPPNMEGDLPDELGLRVFMASGVQGIAYRPGVWHHPLLALDHETEFSCVVAEDGTPGDCEERLLQAERLIDVP